MLLLLLLLVVDVFVVMAILLLLLLLLPPVPFVLVGARNALGSEEGAVGVPTAPAALSPASAGTKNPEQALQKTCPQIRQW